MKPSPAHRQLSFWSRLVPLKRGEGYFAIPVPAATTRALQTRGPVPVSARVNDSSIFFVSLFPMGGGHHYLRVKAKIREEAKIKEGDRVRVRITVLDRSAAVSIPKEISGVLRAKGKLKAFRDLPQNNQRYLIRWIEEAVGRETRVRRIEKALVTGRRKGK